MTPKKKRAPEYVSARTLRRMEARIHERFDTLANYSQLFVQGFDSVHKSLAALRRELEADERFAILGRADQVLLSQSTEVIERLRALLHLALETHVTASIPPTVPRWTEEQRAAFYAGVRDRRAQRGALNGN